MGRLRNKRKKATEEELDKILGPRKISARKEESKKITSRKMAYKESSPATVKLLDRLKKAKTQRKVQTPRNPNEGGLGKYARSGM